MSADIPLDDTGQFDRQLVQIGDVQKGITIDPLDVVLVGADGRCHEQDALTLILLLDATQVFLCGGAVVAGVSGLPIGYQHQDLHILRPLRQLLGDIAKSCAVTVGAAGGDVHEPVAIIPVDGVELCVGVEIDAMLDQLNEDAIAVVVPAMPQSRRILVGGYSVIDGVALINTPVAQDVRTPVKENYIPRLLAGQTRRKVGLVTLDQVLKGKDGIKEALTGVRNDGAGVIIVDAITLEDVDQIAQACIDLDWDVVAVDPGPFTSKLAYRRGLIQEEQPNVPPAASEAGKTVLIAAGSATPVTKKQMQVLCEDSRHVRISVEPIPLINGGDEALDEAFKAVNKAVELIESDKQPRAILFETALHGEILNLDEEDKKRGYAGGMSANRINAGLGTIISQVLEQVGREKIAGLYTTGGDTMVNVCYQLGVECIEVMDYVIPQTDVGRLVGKYDGLPVVGKGGLTGNDNTACDIVERLFKEAAR